MLHTLPPPPALTSSPPGGAAAPVMAASPRRRLWRRRVFQPDEASSPDSHVESLDGNVPAPVVQMPAAGGDLANVAHPEANRHVLHRVYAQSRD